MQDLGGGPLARRGLAKVVRVGCLHRRPYTTQGGFSLVNHGCEQLGIDEDISHRDIVNERMALSEYYTNPRSDVLPFVPDGLGRVLDVGCASGLFGASLKPAKAKEVWGIELNEEVAQHAKPRLDRLLVGDALALLPSLPDASFDAITFTDVLEHLAWPEEALRAAAPKLAPGGVVIASLPNIRHWNALWEIVMDGEFRYREEGIFDRTHLRFFTKKSIPDLFARAGYRIERLEGINPNPGRKFALLNALFLNKFADGRFLQYVVVARPVTT